MKKGKERKSAVAGTKCSRKRIAEQYRNRIGIWRNIESKGSINGIAKREERKREEKRMVRHYACVVRGGPQSAVSALNVYRATRFTLHITYDTPAPLVYTPPARHCVRAQLQWPL